MVSARRVRVTNANMAMRTTLVLSTQINIKAVKIVQARRYRPRPVESVPSLTSAARMPVAGKTMNPKESHKAE